MRIPFLTKTLGALAGLFQAKRNGTAVFNVAQTRYAGMSREVDQFIKEGYEGCVIVFRCVDIVSKAVASIPLIPQRKTAKGEWEALPDTDPLVRLLKKPNPLQTMTDIRTEWTAWRLIGGTGFLEQIRNGVEAKGNAIELWVWNDPKSFKVVKGEFNDSALPVGWVFDNGQAKDKRAWDVDKLTGHCDLVNWKTFNPKSRFFGMSPIHAAAIGVDQHNAAGEWNANLIQNNCTPPGAFMAENTLTPAQYKKLKGEIDADHSGPGNARKAMLMDGNLKYVNFGLNPTDMDYLEGKNLSAREIAGAFGVPTQVIPIQGDQTFANYGQAREALYDDTVIPLAQDQRDTLERFLLPGFGPAYMDGKVRLYLDTSALPALEERRQKTYTTLESVNYLTLNEKRRMVGLSPVDATAADTLFVGAGDIPISDEDEEGETGKDGKEVVGEDVQAQAMNGAQVSSLLEILTAVSAGTLPVETAVQALLIAFPTVDEVQARAMVKPAENYSAAEVTQDEDEEEAVEEIGKALGSTKEIARLIVKEALRK